MSRILLGAVLVGGAALGLTVLAAAKTLPADEANLQAAWRRAGQPESMAALLRDGSFTDSSMVIAWSQLAHANAFATADPPGVIGFHHSRGWTMMYLAMHDALNSIVPVYRAYAYFDFHPHAHPRAAAAQAAHDVMLHIYPTRRAEIDAELAKWLDQMPNDSRKTQGIELGRASAAAIIAAREGDGMLVVGSYAPRNSPRPGDYRLVPPMSFVFFPAFGNSRPFAIGSVKDFLPGPPPVLTSNTYAASYNEVKRLGQRNSALRIQDQTNLGAWWLEFIEVQFGRIMRQITGTRNISLFQAVRMFALVHMAHVDSTVAVWYAKQVYDFWRPIHAIQFGDRDGNPATAADPSWVSEHVVPPVQEYPSAHAIQCQTVTKTLQQVLGTDNVSFATHSTTALPENPVRSFKKLSTAARECQDSRIMAGFHFRFSLNASIPMGNNIARKILDTQLKRRSDGGDN